MKTNMPRRSHLHRAVSEKQLPVRTACVTRLRPLLLLLLLTLPAVVQAQFNYTTNNGTITITGYSGPGGAVVIPSTINGLPVTRIGDFAFYYCTSLGAITVDALNSVYSSEDGVLFNKSQTLLIQCPGGKAGSYTIPNSVTNIEDGAFFSCTSLASVTIPNSVTSIGNEAFHYCTSLSAITVDALNSVYSSEDGVLFNKSQTLLIQCPEGKAGSYTIPNSVTSIGNDAARWPHHCVPCLELRSFGERRTQSSRRRPRNLRPRWRCHSRESECRRQAPCDER